MRERTAFTRRALGRMGRSVSLAVSAFCLPYTLTATTDLTIDLATAAAGTTERPVSTGTYRVKIQNLAPRFFSTSAATGGYKITVAKEEQDLAPLHFPDSRQLHGTGADPCPALLKDLSEASDESKAEGILARSPELVKEGGECHGILLPLTSRMSVDMGTFSLREDQSLTVTIDRGTGADQRTWKYTYTAPPGKGFRVSYGFNFIPNADHEYYAKAPTDGSGPYTLTEKNQTKSLDFAPSIFFSYPMGEPPWQFAIAAGLGFDFSAPIVFLGPSFVINQNIQLVAGAVMQQQERLRGEYNVGQSLKESLTNDQLTQKTYRTNAFVGLSFRFDTNPFTNSSAPAKVAPPAATPTPTPKPTPTSPQK